MYQRYGGLTPFSVINNHHCTLLNISINSKDIIYNTEVNYIDYYCITFVNDYVHIRNYWKSITENR